MQLDKMKGQMVEQQAAILSAMVQQQHDMAQLLASGVHVRTCQTPSRKTSSEIPDSTEGAGRGQSPEMQMASSTHGKTTSRSGDYVPTLHGPKTARPAVWEGEPEISTQGHSSPREIGHTAPEESTPRRKGRHRRSSTTWPTPEPEPAPQPGSKPEPGPGPEPEPSQPPGQRWCSVSHYEYAHGLAALIEDGAMKHI